MLKNDVPNFCSHEIQMFDPNFIGNVEAESVQVENVLPGLRHVQCFQAVITLQGHRHLLLLKPNVGGKRDQIVADRLKYLFGVKPMHVFGLCLNFLYRRGERHECDWIEYLAISMGHTLSRDNSNKLEREVYGKYQTLDKIRSTPLINQLDFQVELCKIVMFKYVIGTSQTYDEHILVRTMGDECRSKKETRSSTEEVSQRIRFEILSISETVITTLCPSRTFLESLRFISPEAWQQAQAEILRHFDYDYERGIILQTRQPELDFKGRKARGPLTMKARDIASCIEDRVSLVTTCDVDKILDSMRGQSL